MRAPATLGLLALVLSPHAAAAPAKRPADVQLVLQITVDQLTIGFMNMTQQGGDFMIFWDDQMAGTAFRVAGQ